MVTQPTRPKPRSLIYSFPYNYLYQENTHVLLLISIISELFSCLKVLIYNSIDGAIARSCTSGTAGFPDSHKPCWKWPGGLGGTSYQENTANTNELHGYEPGGGGHGGGLLYGHRSVLLPRGASSRGCCW